MGLNLIARLGLDGKAFDTGLARAQQRTRKFGGAIKGHLAAAFGSAAIIGMTKRAVDFADEINNLARKTGISTEKLQELSFAANLSGSSLKDVSVSMQRVLEAQSRLAKGNKTTEQSFKQFGLSPADAMTIGPAAMMEQAAKMSQQGEMTAERFAAFRDIFGAEAGVRNIRMMTEGLADMQKQAHSAGAIMDKETIQQIADMKDEFAAFMQSVMPSFAKFATFLMDTSENVVHGLSAIWDSFSTGFTHQIESMGKAWDKLWDGDVLGSLKQLTSGTVEGTEKGFETLMDHVDEFESRKKSKETRRRQKAESAERTGSTMQQVQQLLASQSAAKTTGGNAPASSVDQMARIGLFIGGRQDPIIKKANKQIQEIQQTNAYLQAMHKTIDRKL